MVASPVPEQWNRRAPQLRTLAKWINEHTRMKAEVERSYTNTDTKIGRLRRPGKGRYGNRLIVRDLGAEVLRHDASHPYRQNSEVVWWLRGYLAKNPKAAGSREKPAKTAT